MFWNINHSFTSVCRFLHLWHQSTGDFCRNIFCLLPPPSCGDPGWHHPEQHAGWSRDWEGARGDPQGDAGSWDQSAGSGLWLPACYCIPVHSSGQDHPGPHREHQVGSKIDFKCCGLLDMFIKRGSNCKQRWFCSCNCLTCKKPFSISAGRSTEETWWSTLLLTTKAPE